MQLPIMKDKDGNLFLEIPDNLLQSATSSDSSADSAQLAEKDEQITKLQDKVVELQGKAEAGEQLLAKLKDPVTFVELATHFGHDKLFAEVPADESEDENPEAKAEEKPIEYEVKQGKVDEPGWNFVELFGISVKKKEE